MDLQDDDIFLHLSHRPRHILNGVISVDESTELASTTIQRDSLLGRLDKLPLEVLHEFLSYLDLQSLWRLSRVFLRGKAVVEFLHEYRKLAKFAAHTFKILKQARIVGLYSVSTLYAAFYSKRCISCGAYGAFLFLLSAKRCCFACLVDNQSLWMILLLLVRECFGLTKQQVKALPVMWSIPGKLSSVKAAKELALKVHRLLEELATIYPLDSWNLPTHKMDKFIWYRQAPLDLLSQDPLTIPDANIRPLDEFCGMGSIPFPSLLSGRGSTEPEQGLWCRGCEFTYKECAIEEMDYITLSRLVPPYYRAWSKADFLQHAKHCHSAAAVISQKWIGST
ncbi:uncharacterized protein BDZ99DRAFT_505848 [Mytilinidion resinicola]|uniref:F-box domain-containing protein n=1 Tax=Mytilinidion resinicola TaxID=574789 RepID=A0A6A6Z5N7_9PEZI|nr:uncharacterized protein BDZ99DRAFT_505848 [Mytilinidion resinicola]KAF2816416.1 hypothetical protein BDZ99DRAFT_505848 [Mytilinidion resinicola]